MTAYRIDSANSHMTGAFAYFCKFAQCRGDRSRRLDLQKTPLEFTNGHLGGAGEPTEVLEGFQINDLLFYKLPSNFQTSFLRRRIWG